MFGPLWKGFCWLFPMFQVIRNTNVPGFGAYCVGQGLSLVGTGIQCSVIFSFVEIKTNSPRALGLLQATTAITILLCPFLGGVVADRFNRRAVLIVSMAAALLQALALAVVAWTDWFDLRLVLALNGLAGLITAIEDPTRRAFKSNIAGSDQSQRLEDTTAAYNWVDSTAFTLGLALGGLMIFFLKEKAPAWAFTVNAISYLAALVALAVITVQPLSPVLPTVKRPRSKSFRESVHRIWSFTWLSVKEGWQVVRSSWVVIGFIGQMAILVMFSKRFDSLLPAFAKESLGDQAFSGLFRVAMVIGAILSGQAMARITNKEAKLRWSYRLLPVAPLAMVLFAMSNSPVLAIATLVLATTVLFVQDNCLGAGLQTSVDAKVLGRVNSWRVSLIWSIELIVSLAAGELASEFGTATTLIAFAIPGVVLGLVWWVFMRSRK
jgi:MFS family permease